MGNGLKRAYLGSLKSQCSVNEQGCWIWEGGVDPDGYGVCWGVEVGGKRVQRAHRVTFYLTFGFLPRVLDHIVCDNRRCCNPQHVQASTVKQNTLRGSGPTALNAVKTHCPHGHPYSGKKFQQGGWVRICKICRRESEMRRRAKKER